MNLAFIDLWILFCSKTDQYPLANYSLNFNT